MNQFKVKQSGVQQSIISQEAKANNVSINMEQNKLTYRKSSMTIIRRRSLYKTYEHTAL